MNKKKRNILFLLFCVNFYISTFTFGGGYLILPMMEKNFVEKRGLITKTELFDIAAISQSTPGAIAVNMSSLVGYHICGIYGAIVSCLGATLSPLIVISIVSHYYNVFQSNLKIQATLKGMSIGVAAIIVDFVLSMITDVYKQRDWIMIFLILISFIISFFFKIHVMIVITLSIIICVLSSFIKKHKKEVKIHE